ncbi:MAG: phosphodiester glycosidase family protein [Oscillospiraceae bacterium]|nr:phosphodiester glycosidase family protein [Oscillospiraceae bacterium]
MKKYGRRCAALIATLALAFSLTQPALASYALGSELVEQTVDLGTGTTLTTQSLWSASRSDLRTEHYVTYTPNARVKPVVFSGTYVASTNTVATAASQWEAQGYRVTAAINGGFFNTDGTIVGMLMTDGIVRSLDVESYTLLGFTNDGRVFIDESRPTGTISWIGTEMVQPPEGDLWTVPTPVTIPRSFPMAGFNAYRHPTRQSGLFLYNKDFSSKVNSGGPCVSAILRPVGADGLKMNSSMTFRVESVTDTTQEGVAFNGVIPEGCYMLYGEDHNNADLLAALRALVPGAEVTLNLSGADKQWADAAYGISGLYTLLRNGEIVSGLPTAANPYTAVGIKADGTAVFYTIDGRQSGYSIGATYAQVAERLQELGCVSAVALDGGGSTTLGATLPGSSGFSVVNKPSTAGRRINNTILLVCRAEDAVFEPGAYVSAQHRVVLSGAQLPLTAAAYDSTGQLTDQQYLNWSATGGFISGSGGSATYTAGTTAGTYTVSAGQNSSMSVRVVDQLSRLTVSQKGSSTSVTSLNLKPGDRVDLTATGAWWNLPVAMSKENITWSADPAIGTIDADGSFTAGQSTAEGNITVSAGGRTVTVPVKVDSGCPFADVVGHWSQGYVTQLYQLGLTTGKGSVNGQRVYDPNGLVTRAEMMVFLTNLLGVRADAYNSITLPFADTNTIPSWALPSVKAMYSMKVLKGTWVGNKQYANMNSYITREEAMTFLGRVLAASRPYDLSRFSDAASVSSWANDHVQTLVSLDVVGGSNGRLMPKNNIDRAAVAKILVEAFPLEKALLLPRLDLMS